MTAQGKAFREDKMNSHLKKIDTDLRLIEEDVKPSSLQLEELIKTQERALITPEGLRASLQVYENANADLVQILPTMEPSEIIDTYHQSGRLLRQHLSGYMFRSNNDIYVPVMIEAISNDDENSYLFLMALRRYLDNRIIAAFLRGLDSANSRTRDTALSLVYELRLIEAMDKVHQLEQDQIPMIAKFAEKCFIYFQRIKSDLDSAP